VVPVSPRLLPAAPPSVPAVPGDVSLTGEVAEGPPSGGRPGGEPAAGNSPNTWAPRETFASSPPRRTRRWYDGDSGLFGSQF
jgi:hypothetical protein